VRGKAFVESIKSGREQIVVTELPFQVNKLTWIEKIAELVKESYQDPTTDDANWVVVDVKPFMKLNKPVSLSQVKNDARLSQMALVRLGRLSVQPVTQAEWDIIMELSETKIDFGF
jgi:predicted RNA-binding protein with PUA-like domain